MRRDIATGDVTGDFTDAAGQQARGLWVHRSQALFHRAQVHTRQ
jgi:hypothetical protein